MAVASFKLGKTCWCPTNDGGQLGPEKVAVIRIDAETCAGCRGCPAARDATDVVKTVMRVREPECVALERDADTRERF